MASASRQRKGGGFFFEQTRGKRSDLDSLSTSKAGHNKPDMVIRLVASERATKRTKRMTLIDGHKGIGYEIAPHSMAACAGKVEVELVDFKGGENLD